MTTMSNRLLLSSVFWECEPYPTATASPTLSPSGGGGQSPGNGGQSPGIGGPSTIYTTIYTTTLVNACPTSEWIETYTVTETCTGNRHDYTRPAVPPQFTTTVVVCHVCSHKTQTIYHPAGPTPTSGPGHHGGSGPGLNPPGPLAPVVPAPAPGHDNGNQPIASPTPGGGSNAPAAPAAPSQPPGAQPSDSIPEPPNSAPTPPTRKPNEPQATPTSPQNPAPTTAGAASVKRGVIALTGLVMVLVPLVM